ncbi:MAG: LytR C-terminal domain-containing protein [Solirubrobacterales bacterium]
MVRVIEQIGAFAGLAAFLGLGVLALLSFTHGRDIRRLREWAGSAPERDAERKETTSTIAAQRAEELRQLEQARTAEHEAVSHREERRRRRDAGLPELTRRERFSQGTSDIGARLAEPRWLAAIFVVLVVVVGGVAYTVLSGSDDNASGEKGKQAAAQVQPDEIDVTVLNGTATAGLAATYGDKVEGEGFRLGAVSNTDQSFATSVVMFERGHAPEARRVAKQLAISKLQLMSNEVKAAAAGADVAVVVGEDNAAAAG